MKYPLGVQHLDFCIVCRQDPVVESLALNTLMSWLKCQEKMYKMTTQNSFLLDASHLWVSEFLYLNCMATKDYSGHHNSIILQWEMEDLDTQKEHHMMPFMLVQLQLLFLKP